MGNVINLKGNTIQADTFEGVSSVSDGAITDAKVASDADVAATKIAVASGGDITGADLQTVLEALDARITALENP